MVKMLVTGETMKPAPNWKNTSDIVDAIWKQDLLKYLGKLFKFPVFIETGTCEGSTTLAVKDTFKDIYSVELSPYYHKRALTRLGRISNIHLYLGNSVKLLPTMLADAPNEPTLFWLDAHSSGGLTADEGDPLTDELKIIMTDRPDALIVIDDMLDSELKHIDIDFTGWHREYRTGEIIMHKGQYVIPPFEG